MNNTYIINLDKDTERLSDCMIQCQNAGILNPIRIPGIYGKDLSSEELSENVAPFYKMFGSKSSIGCAMSHIKAWKTMVQNGDQSALFLEDDAIFDPEFKHKFAQIYPTIPKDYHIIYLGCTTGCDINKTYGIEYPIAKWLIGNKYIKKLRVINEHVYVPTMPLALHGYILSRDCAIQLLEHIKKDKIYHHIDCQIIKYIYDLNSYGVAPDLIKQKQVDISTSNNVSQVYPSLISNMLTSVDSHDVPMNYKLSISLFEVHGYPINAYVYIIFILGFILGFIKIPYKKFAISFIIFHVLEFIVRKYPLRIFLKNVVVMYIVYNMGYALGYSRYWGVSKLNK